VASIELCGINELMHKQSYVSLIVDVEKCCELALVEKCSEGKLVKKCCIDIEASVGAR
jgi:hypothetical protein